MTQFAENAQNVGMPTDRANQSGNRNRNADPAERLRFDLSRMKVEVIRAKEEDSGTRVRFLAYLGDARINVQEDIGFGDALGTRPEDILYPTM